MNIDGFLYEHPVFRHEEFVNWRNKQGHTQRHSLNMLLKYYINSGKVTLIRRELYASIPPNQTAESLYIDPYLIAAKSAQDSIIAYHSALELHGIAYSTFGQFTYLTKQKNKPFEFHNHWFQAVSHPSKLQQLDKNYFGIQIINRQGIDIRITNLSRTIVDILDRVELSGGWEEVCRAMNNVVTLNINEAIEYCLMLKNARLAAKLGYFLEHRQGAFAANDKQLKLLLDAKPKIPQYISKNKEEKVKYIKKWNIFIPVSVINQSWEEPHADI